MQAEYDRNEMDALSKNVIGCAYAVSNALGAGFLEKVYENALAHELAKRGFRVAQQYPLDVMYDGVVVGQYVADLLVEGVLLAELKAVQALESTHMAQCLNYLKATGLRLCLLMNFGKSRVEVQRVVHDF